MLASRVGLSPIMIGRAAALAQLQSLVPAAGATAEDLPVVALVSGEAGVGKTRLLRELVASMPPGVALRSVGAGQDALARPYSLVRPLLPAATTDGELESPDRAVAHLLDALPPGPAVVVFEDLHWADAESAMVIDRLARAPHPGLLLIGTYRPDELSRRLPGGELLLRLERRHAVEHVRLDRLRRFEVGALVSAIYQTTPASALIEALYSRTGGNPFYIEGILTAAACRDVEPSDVLTARLPWSLEDAVRSQLEGLDAAQRRVIEAAAICGPTTRFEILARAADLDEAELLTVLRALVPAGLLVEADDDRFSFRHALVSDEVLHQLLGRERRLLHQRALDALTDAASDDLAAMARHAAGAGRFDEFVGLARRGAQQYLAHGSSFQALRLADDALTEAPDDTDLLAVAAEAAWLVSLHDEARGYADRWYTAALAAGDPDQQAGALRWRLRLAHELDLPGAVVDERARLLAVLEQLPTGERRARSMAALAQSHMLQDSIDEAVSWADRAVVEAEAAGAASVAMQARIERGSAVIRRGDPGEELLRAVDDAEAMGEWVLVSRGLNNLFDAVPVFSPEGQALVTRFRAASSRAGYDNMNQGISAYREADIAFGEGNLAAARRAYQQGADGFLHSRKEAYWLRVLGLAIAFEEGRTTDARATLERLREGRPSAISLDEHWRQDELKVLWLEGDRAGVLRAFDAFLAAPLDNDVYLPGAMVELLDLTLDAGAPPDVLRPAVRAALERVGAVERSWPKADGLLLAASGRPDAAAAAMGAGGLVPPYLSGQLRVRLAQARLTAGDRSGALRAVRAALEQDLARWPGWRRDRALALAARIEGATANPEGELTAREREVAALLSEGLTNSELARRLFISPKTAAVHVSNILTKLDMSSRAEVAAWAVRTGLADDVAGNAVGAPMAPAMHTVTGRAG